MRCPGCNTTLRATNVEWLYGTSRRSSESGLVVPSQFVAFSEYSRTDEKEQLYYCQNGDCDVVRVAPDTEDD